MEEMQSRLHISIHTTAKVVTARISFSRHCTFISIHTTAKVVTRKFIDLWEGKSYFNPHHREGGDRAAFNNCKIIHDISIHTTAKVVTK